MSVHAKCCPRPVFALNVLNRFRCCSFTAPSTVCGQYRVLTPTMYRSHMMMANTRQAVSMDYENTAKALREGPSLRVSSSSPFQRGGGLKQDSLDMELGASATGVHR